MRSWPQILLPILALLAPACADDDGDDDSAVADDDDDTSATGDDDTEWDNPYEPPLDLAPFWEFGADPIGEAAQCLSFALPGFSRSVVQQMETLVAEYGNGSCPEIVESGPFDEHLTTYTGGCEADGWAFDGQFSVLDTDAVSHHIWTYVADRFYVRPVDNAHEPDAIQDDEFFFHGMLVWSFTGENVIGTLGMGLGAADTDDPDTAVLQEGFEAHLADGYDPGEPSWYHLYFKGWTETRLDADVNVEHNQDQYFSSAGFWTFTTSSIELMSNQDECLVEPLSGHVAVNGYETVQFVPDGESVCDGQVPVYVATGSTGPPSGYYTGDIW